MAPQSDRKVTQTDAKRKRIDGIRYSLFLPTRFCWSLRTHRKGIAYTNASMDLTLSPLQSPLGTHHACVRFSFHNSPRRGMSWSLWKLYQRRVNLQCYLLQNYRLPLFRTVSGERVKARIMLTIIWPVSGACELLLCFLILTAIAAMDNIRVLLQHTAPCDLHFVDRERFQWNSLRSRQKQFIYNYYINKSILRSRTNS